MKALPAGSKATSVTCLKRPSSAGSGGLGCFRAAVSSSDASCLRPNTIRTRPCGLNLTTMSDPLSVTQMLSLRSTRTVWPNDQAYRFLPISRTNLPSRSNSSSCAAAAAYAGPVVLPRESTNTLPFESTATPVTSPKCRSMGSLRGLGTDSNAITGTDCCPNTAELNTTSTAARRRFISGSHEVRDARRVGQLLQAEHGIAQLGDARLGQRMDRELLEFGDDVSGAGKALLAAARSLPGAV